MHEKTIKKCMSVPTILGFGWNRQRKKNVGVEAERLLGHYSNLIPCKTGTYLYFLFKYTELAKHLCTISTECFQRLIGIHFLWIKLK